MKMKNTVKMVAVAVLLLPLMACQPKSQPVEHEKTIPCYDGSGNFVKWDDDCEDDKLYSTPRPKVTSGGLRTSGPLKPSPRKTR
jgi:hypothetical protein